MLSDKINSSNIKIKRKKNKESPLSKKYRKFLNNENIKLSPSKKTEEIKINVIKKEEVPCKRKRVRIKEGKPNQEDLQQNKKCEDEKVEKVEKIEKVEKVEKKEKKKKSKRKKSKRKKLNSKHTKGRRISLRSSSSKKNKNVNHVIDKVKTMSDESIKKELSKDGIEIKGNKKKLLRDIYVFSKLGGIKIHRE